MGNPRLGATVTNRMKPPASLPGGASSDDRISELPDSVLGSILFLLPLKDAGRTTVLSNRWRGVFAYSPIALDDRVLGRHSLGSGVKKGILRADRVSAINQILAAHKGPIRRVHLEVARFQGDRYGQEGLDHMAFAMRGVEELVLGSTAYPVQFFPAPPLRSVQLLNCAWFCLEPAEAIFAHVKELSLCAVGITEDEVGILLRQCVALESLHLCSYQEDGLAQRRTRMNIAELHVHSPTLRSLDLDIRGLKEVFIWNAPNLERLLGGVRYGSFCHATIYNAPKLRILGLLPISDYNYLASAMGLNLEIWAPTHSVKKLGLCLDVSFSAHVDVLLRTLKLFPSIDTLHIKIPTHENDIHELHEEEVAYAERLEYARYVECLKCSVETIVISDMIWFSDDVCTHKLAGLLREVTEKLNVMKIVSTTWSTTRGNYSIEDENWTSLD